jgi:hypothetical protein
VLDVGRDIERIRDYLAGRLSDQESDAFGERLVRDPELVRELERTLKLSEGLRQLSREARPVQALPQRSTRRAWLPALAAAAALGVLGVGLWVNPATRRAPLLSASLATALAREATSTVASQFTFVPMRGGAAPGLELPRAGIVEFRLAAPAGPAAGGYRVALLSAEPGAPGRTLGSSDVAAIQADGFLHVYADATRLSPGRYSLNVFDAGSGEAALEVYPFSLHTGSPPAP